MKKIVLLLAVLVVIAGCNKEKVYKENLNGVWEVYKYLLYNVDKTASFQNQNPNYTITFTEDGKFTEFLTDPDSVYVNGTYGFADNDEKIVLTHTDYSNFSIDTLGDTTFVPEVIEREFTIFNLTRTHVQLLTDSSQRYMNKKED